MALSSFANGTQSASIGTEHTLGTPSSPGTYLLVVDTTNMQNGDTLELRGKSAAKAGGSNIQFFCGQYANVQADPMKISVPIPAVDGCTFTLKQVAGSGRNFDWNIYQL